MNTSERYPWWVRGFSIEIGIVNIKPFSFFYMPEFKKPPVRYHRKTNRPLNANDNQTETEHSLCRCNSCVNWYLYQQETAKHGIRSIAEWLRILL